MKDRGGVGHPDRCTRGPPAQTQKQRSGGENARTTQAGFLAEGAMSLVGTQKRGGGRECECEIVRAVAGRQAELSWHRGGANAMYWLE